MDPQTPAGTSTPTRRRAWLAGITAVAGLAPAGYAARNPIGSWLFTRSDNSAVRPIGLGADESGSRILTAEAIEGSFYIETSPQRRDVREDRRGVPMLLRLRIVDHTSCGPIPGAMVAIWQADALGRYSGHADMDPSAFPRSAPCWQRRAPASASRWLRGHQLADAQGLVEFETLFPGWYTPRTLHVHVKAVIAGRDRATTQLYFPQQLCDEVAVLAP
jgi:protocatechuate 3,4-dioxygenase beta subunit